MATTKSNENILGAVAYLLGWVTGIVLLLVEKENKFVRFHAMQSTILFGALTLIGFVPFIGWILAPILAIPAFILWLFLMWKAFNGESYKVPYVGDFAEKQLAKMG